MSANARAVEADGMRYLKREIGHRPDRQTALDDKRVGALPDHGRESVVQLSRDALQSLRPRVIATAQASSSHTCDSRSVALAP